MVDIWYYKNIQAFDEMFFFHFLVYLYFLKLPSASPWRHQIKTQDQQETPLWNSSRYYNTKSTERLPFYHNGYDNQNIIVLILVSFDSFFFFYDFASLSSRKWQHVKDSCQNSAFRLLMRLWSTIKLFIQLCCIVCWKSLTDWVQHTFQVVDIMLTSCHLETSLMPVWLWGSLKGF